MAKSATPTDPSAGPIITVGRSELTVLVTYADGSAVQMTMPRPEGLEPMSQEQIEQLARRMARRLLAAANEDLDPKG
jgi:hypothetical protein